MTKPFVLLCFVTLTICSAQLPLLGQFAPGGAAHLTGGSGILPVLPLASAVLPNLGGALQSIGNVVPYEILSQLPLNVARIPNSLRNSVFQIPESLLQTSLASGSNSFSSGDGLLRLSNIPASVADNLRLTVPLMSSGEDGVLLYLLALMRENSAGRSGESTMTPTITERLTSLLGGETLQRILEGDVAAFSTLGDRFPGLSAIGDSFDEILNVTEGLPLRRWADRLLSRDGSVLGEFADAIQGRLGGVFI